MEGWLKDPFFFDVQLHQDPAPPYPNARNSVARPSPAIPQTGLQEGHLLPKSPATCSVEKGQKVFGTPPHPHPLNHQVAWYLDARTCPIGGLRGGCCLFPIQLLLWDQSRMTSILRTVTSLTCDSTFLRETGRKRYRYLSCFKAAFARCLADGSRIMNHNPSRLSTRLTRTRLLRTRDMAKVVGNCP